MRIPTMVIWAYFQIEVLDRSPDLASINQEGPKTLHSAPGHAAPHGAAFSSPWRFSR